jgi:hypothetical protein
VGARRDEVGEDDGLDVGDEEGGDDVGEWDEVGGGDDDHNDGGGVGGGDDALQVTPNTLLLEVIYSHYGCF